MTMKPFPNNRLLLLGPVFLVASDFVITRFSQSGAPKKLANNTRQQASSSLSISSYNPHSYRSSWIQSQLEKEPPSK